MQEILLPERITPQGLKKLCLANEVSEDGKILKGVHYERHLVFAITSDSLHDSVTALPRAEVTCFRCGEKGHKKGECRTYRTKMCRQPSDCKDPNCPFAHTAMQLRTPWVARCIRVIRADGQLKRIGCGRTGHTFRECPFQITTPLRVGDPRQAPFCQPVEKKAHMFKTGEEWDRYLREVEDDEPPLRGGGVVAALAEHTNDHQRLDEVAQKLAAPPKHVLDGDGAAALEAAPEAPPPGDPTPVAQAAPEAPPPEHPSPPPVAQAAPEAPPEDPAPSPEDPGKPRAD